MNGFRQSLAWMSAKRLALDPARRGLAKVAHRGCLPLAWHASRNWGDALSPVLASLLAGRRVAQLNGLHHDRYLAIGSILGSANERAEVWGSGLMTPDAKVLGRPRAIHAVRGPLSRAALRQQGFDCPEIYGDPALLLPMFFNPAVPQRWAVGLIPHYADKEHPWVARQQADPQVRVIDVEGGLERFVEEIKSCEVVVSSSLHGLICADAYGVPGLWVELSDRVLGHGFKFQDYFGSIQREVAGPILPHESGTLAELTARLQPYKVAIDLLQLLRSCPFLKPELQAATAREKGGCLPAGFVQDNLKLEGE